ncbi:hypothetical protein E5288_WYG007023 [Bos mutus]|uniref:Uncharacterized protein n=1 Tax=Bos mutus TaxID=72004 RepID=A0A6B0QQC9_9CETA|nr:hypothetical protein [Bos mutus]
MILRKPLQRNSCCPDSASHGWEERLPAHRMERGRNGAEDLFILEITYIGFLHSDFPFTPQFNRTAPSPDDSTK